MSIYCGHLNVVTGWVNLLDVLPFTPQGVFVFGVDQGVDGFGFDTSVNFGTNTLSAGIGSRVGPAQGEIAVSERGDPVNPLESLLRRNYGGRVTTNARLFGTAKGSITPDLPGRTLGLSSWDSCGWNIGAGGVGASPWRVHYIAFAGVTLNCAMKVITIPGDGSTAVLTGLPFDPTLNPTGVIFLTTRGTSGADTAFSNIGFYANGNQFASSLITGYQAFAAYGQAQAGVICIDQTGNSLSVGALTSDGLTITQSAANGASYTVLALILSDEAGEFNVGSSAWGSASMGATNTPEAVLLTSGMTRSPVADSDPNHVSGQWSMGFAAADGKSGGVVLGEGGGFSTDVLRWSAMNTDNGIVLETWDVYTSTVTRESGLTVGGFAPGGVPVSMSGATPPINFGWMTAKTSKASASPCRFTPQIYRILP